jgi:hypothetical protein
MDPVLGTGYLMATLFLLQLRALGQTMVASGYILREEGSLQAARLQDTGFIPAAALGAVCCGHFAAIADVVDTGRAEKSTSDVQQVRAPVK